MSPSNKRFSAIPRGDRHGTHHALFVAAPTFHGALAFNTEMIIPMSRSHSELSTFLATLNTRGHVVIRGVAALQTLRGTIAEATRTLGVQVYLDLQSEPDLVDYLGVTVLSAANDALKGAALGLLLGALFGAPREGVIAGATLGAGVGVVRGLDQVGGGWRIRLSRDAFGEPVALVTLT